MKNTSKSLSQTNDGYKNILGDHNRSGRVQISSLTHSQELKSSLIEAENFIPIKIDQRAIPHKISNPNKAQSIQHVENELKKAVNNLRQKNEAQSKQISTVTKAFRSNTAEKLRGRPRLNSNDESTPKKVMNLQTNSSLSRNSSKSPNGKSQKSVLSLDPTKKSLNLSSDEDKLEGSFVKSKTRTCLSSSKKVDTPQREQYNAMLSNVYAVKKINFMKISPLGKGSRIFLSHELNGYKIKGKRASDPSKGSSCKFTQALYSDDEKTDSKALMRKSISNIISSYHSIPPFQASNTVSNIEPEKVAEINPKPVARRPSIVSVQKKSAILSSLVKLLNIKKLQVTRQAFSKLQNYVQVIKAKIFQFLARRRKVLMRSYFSVWKSKHSQTKLSEANADAYRKWKVLSKYFLKGWHVYSQLCKAAKKNKHVLPSKVLSLDKKSNRNSKPNSRNPSVSKTNDLPRAIQPQAQKKPIAQASAKEINQTPKSSSSSTKNKQIKKKVVKSKPENHSSREDNGEIPRTYTPSQMEANVKNQLEQSFGLDNQSNPAYPEGSAQKFLDSEQKAVLTCFSDQEDEIDQIMTNIRKQMITIQPLSSYSLAQPIKHEMIQKMSPTNIHSLRSISMQFEEISNHIIMPKVSINKAMHSKDHSDCSMDLSNPRNQPHELKAKPYSILQESGGACAEKRRGSLSRGKGLNKTAEEEKDNKIYQIKLNKALHFHRKQIMVNTIFHKHVLRLFKKKNWGFLPWKRFIETLEIERDPKSDESVSCEAKLQKAEAHYKYTLKMNVFNCFLKYYVDCFEQNKILIETRENYIQKTFFKRWVSRSTQIKLEKSRADHLQYDKIWQKFRFIVLGEKVLKGWKEYVLASHRSSQN